MSSDFEIDYHCHRERGFVLKTIHHAPAPAADQESVS
jgi:hypothetical protein